MHAHCRFVAGLLLAYGKRLANFLEVYRWLTEPTSQIYSRRLAVGLLQTYCTLMAGLL
jgi:hypothetical protein